MTKGFIVWVKQKKKILTVLQVWTFQALVASLDRHDREAFPALSSYCPCNLNQNLIFSSWSLHRVCQGHAGIHARSSRGGLMPPPRHWRQYNSRQAALLHSARLKKQIKADAGVQMNSLLPGCSLSIQSRGWLSPSVDSHLVNRLEHLKETRAATHHEF